MAVSTDVDVAVIGAGPGGSSCAALLAEAGCRVRVFERTKFPRFHIGESLLPVDLPIFERLGFDAKRLPSVYKAGADFVDERTGDFGRFPFSEGLPGTPSHAWQVERAKFDEALAARAAELGAEVRFETPVQRVDFGSGHVTLEHPGGPTTARYVVDATGRDRLLCKQHKSFERIEAMGLAAVWDHFTDLDAEIFAEVESTGNVAVLLLEDGWGWIIPLAGRTLSVGFVSARQGVVSDAWFEASLLASPMLQRLTAGAKRTGLQRAGDYSFKNTQPHGARFGCVGDAHAFLDPVFSSGVTFALESGVMLADLLVPAIAAGREAEPDLMRPIAEKMAHAHAVFRALIERFYHRRLVQKFFFYDDPDPQIRAGFISVLAGDVWRDDNVFQDMLLRSRRRKPKAEAQIA
jgi:flavin-dependent dehydrogenase